MSQITNPWRGWVRNYLATQNINQLELAQVFQCNFTLVNLWLNKGQTPTRQMLERARDRMAFKDWLGACLAGGFVPPSLGAEALNLMLELAAMPPNLQAQVAASFRAARCA